MSSVSSETSSIATSRSSQGFGGNFSGANEEFQAARDAGIRDFGKGGQINQFLVKVRKFAKTNSAKMREYGFNWIITKSGEISLANRARKDVADFIKKLTPEEVEYIKGGGQDPTNISLFDVNPIFSKDKMEETQPTDPISQAELDRRMAEIRAAFAGEEGPSSSIEKGKQPQTTTSTEIIPDIIKETQPMPISQAAFAGEAGPSSLVGKGKETTTKMQDAKKIIAGFTDADYRAIANAIAAEKKQLAAASKDAEFPSLQDATSGKAKPAIQIQKQPQPVKTTQPLRPGAVLGDFIPRIIKPVETMQPESIEREIEKRDTKKAVANVLATLIKKPSSSSSIVKDIASFTDADYRAVANAIAAEKKQLAAASNVQNNTPVVNTPESQVPVQQPPAQAADPLTQPAPVPIARPVGNRIPDSDPNPFPVPVRQFETNENRMGIDAANKAAGDGNDDGNKDAPSGQGNGGFSKTYTHDGLGRIVIKQPTEDSILDTSNRILEIQRQTTAGKEVAANDANNELQIILKILAQYKAETDAALEAHKINKIENVERLLQKPDPATIEAANLKAEAERRRQLMMQPIVWSSTPGPY